MPIKEESMHPFMDINFNITPSCSREAELEQRDLDRQYQKEMERCCKRRTRAGFEVIDNLRYVREG